MGADSEPAVALSIGAIVGGSTQTNQPWVAEIGQVMRDIGPAREGVLSDINVNVEFHVPGNLLVPEFEGVRTGYFRKSDRYLKVQVAVVVTECTNPRAAIIDDLWQSLDAVDSWVTARNRGFHTDSQRTILWSLDAAARP